jgi:hypothetical protein
VYESFLPSKSEMLSVDEESQPRARPMFVPAFSKELPSMIIVSIQDKESVVGRENSQIDNTDPFRPTFSSGCVTTCTVRTTSKVLLLSQKSSNVGHTRTGFMMCTYQEQHAAHETQCRRTHPARRRGYRMAPVVRHRWNGDASAKEEI